MTSNFTLMTLYKPEILGKVHLIWQGGNEDTEGGSENL